MAGTWERAAYIKGDPRPGIWRRDQISVGPAPLWFWRKHLWTLPLYNRMRMTCRLAIRERQRAGGKGFHCQAQYELGRAAMPRDRSFFTQTRQLIAGGPRTPDLRVRVTAKAWLYWPKGMDFPAERGETLLRTITVRNRTVEHGYKMIRDAQTTTLHQSDEGFDRLGRE